jgi:hypothetical protein
MSMQQHLSNDEVIIAVVDPADLSPEKREHLESCRVCRVELDKLDADLVGLGETASHMVEVPPRNFELPGAEQIHHELSGEMPRRPETRWQNWWSRQGQLSLAGGLAMAAAVVLALMVSLSPEWKSNPPLSLLMAQEQELNFILAIPQEPEPLLGMLADASEPLSPFHRFLVGDDDTEEDNEFMEFLAPEKDGNLTSLDRRSVG